MSCQYGQLIPRTCTCVSSTTRLVLLEQVVTNEPQPKQDLRKFQFPRKLKKANESSYSLSTSSDALLVRTEPSRFRAAHWYRPMASTRTLSMTRNRFRSGNRAPGMLGEPSFVHVILGNGLPLTAQSSLNSAPRGRTRSRKP